MAVDCRIFDLCYSYARKFDKYSSLFALLPYFTLKNAIVPQKQKILGHQKLGCMDNVARLLTALDDDEMASLSVAESSMIALF